MTSKDIQTCKSSFHILTTYPERELYINEELRISTERRVTDSKIVQLVTKLLEPFLERLDGDPALQELSQFKIDVHQFIYKSKETVLFGEKDRLLHETHEAQFLLQLCSLLEEKQKFLAEVEKTRLSSKNFSSEVKTILDKQADTISDDEILCLYNVKQLMYLEKMFMSDFSKYWGALRDQQAIRFSLPSHVFHSIEGPQFTCGIHIESLLGSIEDLSIVLKISDAFEIKQEKKLLSKIKPLVAEMLDTSSKKILTSFSLIEFNELISKEKELYHPMDCSFQIYKSLVSSHYSQKPQSCLLQHYADRAYAECIKNINDKLIELQKEFSDKECSAEVYLFYEKKISLLYKTALQLIAKQLERSEQDLQLYQTIEQKVQNWLDWWVQTANTSKTKKRLFASSLSRIKISRSTQTGVKTDIYIENITFADFQKLVRDVKEHATPTPTRVSKMVDKCKSEITSLESSFQALSISPQVKEKPKNTTTFSYHRRVSRWWQEAESIFLNDSKYNSTLYTETAKKWIIAQHSFSQAADHIVKSEGLRYENQCVAAGEMEINGEKKRGLFTFAFTENGVCFHRYFTEKTTDEIIQGYVKQKFYDLDFPVLTTEDKTQGKQLIPEDLQDCIEILPHVVTIIDKRNEAILRICRATK